MSKYLIATIGLVYLYISAEQYFKGNPGPAIMWFGYALANGGLCMVSE